MSIWWNKNYKSLLIFGGNLECCCALYVKCHLSDRGQEATVCICIVLYGKGVVPSDDFLLVVL